MSKGLAHTPDEARLLSLRKLQESEVEQRIGRIAAESSLKGACLARQLAIFMSCMLGAALCLALFVYVPRAYNQGRADALTAVCAQQQAATVALKDAKRIREASIAAVVLAADALRVCSGEAGR